MMRRQRRIWAAVKTKVKSSALFRNLVQKQLYFCLKKDKEKLIIICQSKVLLGDPDLPRVATLSFLVKHSKSGLFLHQNFVCALLSDLFGLQCRARAADEAIT